MEVNVDDIDINDPATYQLYCDGRTIGTFQFESTGMQRYLKELQPHAFEDLIAMNALYRPGPMDYIPDFIDRKQGRKPIVYDIPCMEKYLKDTYGITVYQEQVMLLSRQLANFTRGESDALRKAMGKKKKDIVDAMKPKFIEQGKENGHKPEVLEKIWADWEKFASYAFNKSHATCYSWVAFQTAFLKARFPAQYMAAVMSRSLDNISDIRKLMDECKAVGINTLGPNVNESRLKFSVNKEGDIRFGMGGIKGVGESGVIAIIKEREKNGEFRNMFDFFERINMAACNRKCLEGLILSGAMDGFKELPREGYFAYTGKGTETYLDVLMRYGQKYQIAKQQATQSLFGAMDFAETVVRPPFPSEISYWGTLERLNKERELVGIYLSAHPLDDYAFVLNNVCNTKLPQLEDKAQLAAKKELTFGGIVTNIRVGETKRGNLYGIVKMEDFTGSGELAMFGKDWLDFHNCFIEGASLFIRASMVPSQWKPNEFMMQIKTVELLSEVKDSLVEKITLTVPLESMTSTLVQDLAEIVQECPGESELYFNVHSNAYGISTRLFSRKTKIAVQKPLIHFFEAHKEIEISVNT